MVVGQQSTFIASCILFYLAIHHACMCFILINSSLQKIRALCRHCNHKLNHTQVMGETIAVVIDMPVVMIVVMTVAAI